MNVIIADDHSVVRRGLQQIIETQPGWKVIAEVATADEVLPALRCARPDVLVLDVAFGGRSGIDLLGSIRSERPALPILMLSMYNDEQYAIPCIRAGASGYLQKDSTPEELVGAMRHIAAGHIYISAAVADQLAAELVHGRTDQPHERLSAREFEVFRLIGSGKSVSEIAETLHLSAKTVSTYRTRILEKTGFRSNAEMTVYALRTGLI